MSIPLSRPVGAPSLSPCQADARPADLGSSCSSHRGLVVAAMGDAAQRPRHPLQGPPRAECAGQWLPTPVPEPEPADRREEPFSDIRPFCSECGCSKIDRPKAAVRRTQVLLCKTLLCGCSRQVQLQELMAPSWNWPQANLTRPGVPLRPHRAGCFPRRGHRSPGPSEPASPHPDPGRLLSRLRHERDERKP
jgi:hypothetical protein